MLALHPDAPSVDLIRGYANRLATLAEQPQLDEVFLTWGDWTLADLVWHLTTVQDFWAFIVANRPEGPESYVPPRQPADSRLAAGLREATDRLASALDQSDPNDIAWTWSEEQTVRFTLRRQTHEALIHYVDGLLALGRDIPAIDAFLAADGVDEIVTVMLCGAPGWAEFKRTSGVVQLRTTDTGDLWTMAFGRITGFGPTSGRPYNIEALELVQTDAAADAVISAPALDLDLWLWGRDPGVPVEVVGTGELATRLREIIILATQ